MSFFLSAGQSKAALTGFCTVVVKEAWALNPGKKQTQKLLSLTQLPPPWPKPLPPASVAKSVAWRITTDSEGGGGGLEGEQTCASFPTESKHNGDCDEVASFSACNLPSGFPLFYTSCPSPSCFRFLPKCLLASCSLVAQWKDETGERLFLVGLSFNVDIPPMLSCLLPGAILWSLLNATFSGSLHAECGSHLQAFVLLPLLRVCVCVLAICRLCLLHRVYIRCPCKYSCGGFFTLRYLWLFSSLNRSGPRWKKIL